MPPAQVLLIWTHHRVPFSISGHLSAQEYLAVPSSPVCQALAGRARLRGEELTLLRGQAGAVSERAGEANAE